MNMSPVRSTRLTLWLSELALFMPFMWIKIGPMGIAFYGPDVPDIYILGIMCTGKDWRFSGIPLAMAFQLVFGLCFILCSFMSYRRALQHAPVRGLAMIQLLLLLLFPFWLGLYVNGVIHNSDGAAADLRVYPHIGLLVYILLVALTINTFRKGARGMSFPMGPAWVRGFSMVQLIVLVLLPFWLGPVLKRGVDNEQALLGMGVYSLFGISAYIVLLGSTIRTFVSGRSREEPSTDTT